MADARDLLRLEERLAFSRTRDQPRHRDRITADIENAAAGRLVGKQPVLGPEGAHVEAEAGADDAHRADRARLDQFDDLRGLRMNAVHEGLAGKDAGLLRFMIDRLGIEGRQRDRLFH
jgi:hypothetical protein